MHSNLLCLLRPRLIAVRQFYLGLRFKIRYLIRGNPEMNLPSKSLLASVLLALIVTACSAERTAVGYWMGSIADGITAGFNPLFNSASNLVFTRWRHWMAFSLPWITGMKSARGCLPNGGTICGHFLLIRGTLLEPPWQFSFA